MSLTLLHTDLYRFPCDAAVIPSDEWQQYSGREAVCAPGRAAPAERGCCEAACSALFVTAAPPQQSSAEEAAEVLAACYRNSLDLAAGSGCKKTMLSDSTS